MLYIFVIQESASSPGVYSDYLTAAMQCQSHLSAIAEKGSLSERYSLVLEELRLEALSQVRSMSSYANQLGDKNVQEREMALASMAIHDHPSADVNCGDFTGQSMMDFNGSIPGLSLSDYSDWGHFNSMVSSGLGNMDSLFC